MNGFTAAGTLRIPDYELLRLVGQGSYGEVWMARNALGSFRAVKVVWRRSFEDDRPYEREFHGIRKYEPVSRKHEGLIDIYHVGRNNEAGYFYYVMELADDAASSLDSVQDYRPMTLREELRARGRMSIPRSVEIGVKLASALEHLHRAGLVHRDIKPSNIIFIGGAPKLADIGLVAGISDARSYVGTEGFVPPEGPGSPSADVFSLGKVLYEISTGLDRNDFPKLPPMGGKSGLDPQEFAEFNEVLVKACDPAQKSRYETAAELFEELILLQGGKSLRRVRGLERRTALLSKVGIAAAVIAVVASMAYYGSFKQIQRAVRAEQQAMAHVQRLETQTAEELFRRDDSSSALAYLAHVIRSNPTNRVAIERLMWALTWRNFLLPELEPITPAGRLQMASFDARGREVTGGSANGTLQTWDTLTGRTLQELRPAGTEILACDWGPEKSRFIFGTPQGGILHDSILDHSIPLESTTGQRVDCVRLSPDQRWVLTAVTNGNVHIWDADRGQLMDHVLAHGGRVHRIVFSPNGRRVATVGLNDGAARIWDPLTGQPLSPILRHGNRINEIAFSADGHMLATAGSDGTAQIWHVPIGTLLGSVPHRAQVSDVAFSPDGGKLATASEDGTAALWELEKLQPIGAPLRHRAWVKGVKFSPDGLRLVTISEDNMARLWDAASGAPVSEPMRHPFGVVCACFSPHGDRLLTGASSINESGLWLWKTGDRSARSLQFPVGPGKRSACLLRDSHRLCLVSDRSMQFWSSKANQPGPEVVDLGVPVDAFNLAPNGQRAVVVYGSKAWVWDLPSRQSIKGPMPHSSPIHAAEFSPNAELLALATEGGHLVVWKINPGPGEAPSLEYLPQQGAAISSEEGILTVRFSPDGHRLVAACRDRKARLFDTSTGRLLREFPHESAVLSADFSPDSRLVVTASSDRTAQIWNATTGVIIGEAMHHDNDVLLAKFSGDGRRVATASRDWTARIWDVQTGLPVSEPIPHAGPVQAICFSPDNVRVATGSVDGTARIWDAESGQPLSEAINVNGPVENLEFSADGSELLIVPALGEVCLVGVIQPEVPAPAWLPDLAEAVARHRLNRKQMSEPVPARRLFELKRTVDAGPDSDPYARWGKWFLADPVERTIAPGSAVQLSNHVGNLIQSGTLSQLKEAILLQPTNALAHVLMAKSILWREQNPPYRDILESDWHRREARRLAPTNAEILEIYSELSLRSRSLRGER